MFSIAEEYIKTIKENPDETYFFVLKKIEFQIFKICKKRKFEKTSEKSKFEKKNRNLKIICENSINFENFDFRFFPQNFDF